VLQAGFARQFYYLLGNRNQYYVRTSDAVRTIYAMNQFTYPLLYQEYIVLKAEKMAVMVYSIYDNVVDTCAFREH